MPPAVRTPVVIMIAGNALLIPAPASADFEHVLPAFIFGALVLLASLVFWAVSIGRIARQLGLTRGPSICIAALALVPFPTWFSPAALVVLGVIAMRRAQPTA